MSAHNKWAGFTTGTLNNYDMLDFDDPAWLPFPEGNDHAPGDTTTGQTQTGTDAIIRVLMQLGGDYETTGDLDITIIPTGCGQVIIRAKVSHDGLNWLPNGAYPATEDFLANTAVTPGEPNRIHPIGIAPSGDAPAATTQDFAPFRYVQYVITGHPDAADFGHMTALEVTDVRLWNGSYDTSGDLSGLPPAIPTLTATALFVNSVSAIGLTGY